MALRSGAWLVLVWAALAAHQLPGDDGLHHFGGAVADLEPDDIPHALLKGQLVRVAVVAVEEQALVDGLDGQLRAPPLDHGRFLRVRLALIRKPERPVTEAAAGVDVGRRLGDSERDALERRQRL